jgi:hypothetical protein
MRLGRGDGLLGNADVADALYPPFRPLAPGVLDVELEVPAVIRAWNVSLCQAPSRALPRRQVTA